MLMECTSGTCQICQGCVSLLKSSVHIEVIVFGKVPDPQQGMLVEYKHGTGYNQRAPPEICWKSGHAWV